MLIMCAIGLNILCDQIYPTQTGEYLDWWYTTSDDPQFPNHTSEMMSPGLQCNKKESYLWLLQKKGLFSSSSTLVKLFANLWTDDVCKKISVHHFVPIGCCCLLTSPLPQI